MSEDRVGWLRPQEVIVKKSVARHFQRVSRQHWPHAAWFADGWLYLTSERIIWRKGWFTVPLVPVKPFELELDRLNECEVRGSAATMFLGGGGGFILKTFESEYRLLVAKQRLWPPAFWFSKGAAKEWCEMIDTAAKGASAAT